MTPEIYISQQAGERQTILTDIHQIILENDDTIEAEIEPMMGKEMILYKANGSMKYGLASTKKYMSLHLLPMYMAKELHEKYTPFLSKASFQKGCINFTHAAEMPLPVVKELIIDCSKINLAKIREDYLKARKNKGK